MESSFRGLVPDGLTDCTQALQDAASHGPVRLSAGRYRISRTITFTLGEHGPSGLFGAAGATIVHAGPGPALRFIGTHQGTALPESVRAITWARERLPMVDGVELVGDHPEADGIELSRCFKPILRGVLVRDCRVGVRLSDRNRDVIITGCHVYNNREQGIYLDAVNLHQLNITGCHISYNRGGGIVCFGSEVRNLQVSGCDIEYNYDRDDLSQPAADVWIETRGGSVREGAITGCTIQAQPSIGGANIRLVGESEELAHKVGLFSIAGNLISSQQFQVHLKYARGLAISGNTFFSGGSRTILAEHSSHLTIAGNVIDHNPDYRGEPRDGIELREVDGASLTGNLLANVEHPDSALAIERCHAISVGDCQVLSPRGVGISVNGSTNVRIADTTILDDRRPMVMPHAVRFEKVRGCQLCDCRLDPGTQGAIAIVDGEVQTDDHGLLNGPSR